MLPTVIPYAFGSPAGSSGLYTATGFAYNYAIGAIPFLSAASVQNPIVRASAPIRKQQFDASSEPGEQSLEGWWLRSQQSFHGGEGQLFADPSSNDPNYSPVRYFTGRGVDPWTPGSVKLLHSTTRVVTTKALKQLSTAGNGVPIAINTTDNKPTFFVDPSSPTHDNNPSVKTLYSASSTATKYLVSAADGIWERAHSASMGTAWTKIWNITPDQASVISFVKQRLVLADADGVYELASGGPALPTAKWTAPTGGWTPIGIAESSDSIYVAGQTDKGFVLRFELDTAGAMPTLGTGRVVLELPHGESITSIFGYLGRFLAVGTSLGARVARIDDNGALELGPLLWELPTAFFAAAGTFLYAGVYDSNEQTQGVYRIDLATEFTDLRFAYAHDLALPSNASQPAGLAWFPSTGRLVIVSPSGAWYEDATYVSTGYLETSRIRFGTLEPKLYKLIRVRGPVLEGAVAISIIDPTGTRSTITGYGIGAPPGTEDADIPALGPLDYASIRFDLSNANAGADTAEITAYQLKALPASPRQRLIRLPLLCFDTESDRHGVMAGGEGTAILRILSLEDVEATADVVYLQDFDRDNIERVVIESIEFVQTKPPDAFMGWGGIITLTVRTV